MLRKEREAQPSRIPYFVTISEEYPGKFMLHYLPTKSVKHELINLTPDGLRFRGKNFKNLDQLINWFKKHWREVPSSSSTSRKAASKCQNSHRWLLNEKIFLLFFLFS